MGRPPRITRDDIVQAARTIGFDDVTMKAVAAHLGVSIPGLYHYVRGREDLLRLVADHALADSETPKDNGQNWADWLREWARHTRRSMGQHPELIEHYAAGGLDNSRILAVIDLVLGVLVRHGFEPADAQAAYEDVSMIALGTAIEDIRLRHETEDGNGWTAQVAAYLDEIGPERPSALRALLDEPTPTADQLDERFERRVDALLVGIAKRHGRRVTHVTRTAPPP
jgi:AcrR family transcriptional regulator